MPSFNAVPGAEEGRGQSVEERLRLGAPVLEEQRLGRRRQLRRLALRVRVRVRLGRRRHRRHKDGHRRYDDGEPQMAPHTAAQDRSLGKRVLQRKLPLSSHNRNTGRGTGTVTHEHTGFTVHAHRLTLSAIKPFEWWSSRRPSRPQSLHKPILVLSRFSSVWRLLSPFADRL